MGRCRRFSSTSLLIKVFANPRLDNHVCSLHYSTLLAERTLIRVGKLWGHYCLDLS